MKENFSIVKKMEKEKNIQKKNIENLSKHLMANILMIVNLKEKNITKMVK